MGVREGETLRVRADLAMTNVYAGGGTIYRERTENRGGECATRSDALALKVHRRIATQYSHHTEASGRPRAACEYTRLSVDAYDGD